MAPRQGQARPRPWHPHLPIVKVRPPTGGGAGGGKPIVLRLRGRPRPRVAGRRMPLGPLPTPSERLPVVALPDRAVAGARYGASGVVTGAALAGPPEAAYRRGHRLLSRKAWAQAARVFSALARRYPKHALADNALYWLAECLMRQGKVRQAAWVLRKLLRQYPSGNKAPSGLVKLALCEVRLGKTEQAKRHLAQVVSMVPGSREARLAAAELRRLR